MRIATWNVNSVRARLEPLLAWLDRSEPDVVCLQETKVVDDEFPRAELEERGYHVEAHGQRAYNGVALLSREPLAEVRRGFPGDPDPEQCRVLSATVAGVRVVDVYVVNGTRVGSERYAFKLEWLERLADFLRDELSRAERLVVTGDFNVTFDDRDVYDPEAWRERILCSTPERRALAGLVDLGLVDAFRRLHEEGGHYTWWDFRTRGFARNRGLRIDHFLMSRALVEECRAVEIDVAVRGGAKPSDHAPVVATLAQPGQRRGAG